MTIRERGSRATGRPPGGGRVETGRRFAVVMAGGSGTRFWPWSRESTPKQFLALTSSRSMLAETVGRLKGLVPPGNILVVTSRRHLGEVRSHLPSLPAANVLGEPVGRNTAACIGWAALEIHRRRPDAVIAVLSADHAIPAATAFRRDLARAFAVADRSRRLVTFGIRPTSPATGYGYIRTGAALAGTGAALEVEAFVEKPALAAAKRYVASGRYLWNSGMFVWRVDAIREELEAHLPALAATLAAMDRLRRRGVIPPSVLDRHYPKLESISIDHGVMERSRRVATIAASFAWSDIGTWDAVAGLWPADKAGNVSRDPVVAVDASSNIVATRGKPVILLGVEDLVVVDAGDALLVCSRERAQDVRLAVAALGPSGLGALR